MLTEKEIHKKLIARIPWQQLDMSTPEGLTRALLHAFAIGYHAAAEEMTCREFDAEILETKGHA